MAIRSDGGDYLILAFLGRSHPEATDYWDANWICVSIDFVMGGFRGSVGGDLRAEELAAFYEQFVPLQRSLHGIANFETMEGWLSIRVTGDGKGRMEIRCVIRDQPGIGNKLEGTISTDQTYTRKTVAALGGTIQAFPVIGHP